MPDMPEAPEVHVMSQRRAVPRRARARAAAQPRHRQAVRRDRRRRGAARLSATRSARPSGSAETAARSPGCSRRRPSPLSPVMTGRSLSVHFDTVTVPLADAKAAAKAAGGKLNDAFLAATAAGFRRYHEALGSPAEALRMSMPISIRDEATSDLAGNQFVPARFPIPLTIDRPGRVDAARCTTSSPSSGPSRRWPWSIRWPGSSTACPTSVSTGIFGSMLRGHRPRHEQRARRADPDLHRGQPDRGDVRRSGPMTGAAREPHPAQLPRRAAHRRQRRPGGGHRARPVRRLLPRGLGRGAQGRCRRDRSRVRPTGGPYPRRR